MIPNLWIGTGWKMNHTLATAANYANVLKIYLQTIHPALNIFILPSFIALPRVCALLAGTPTIVGCQNMHWEDEGAFTGEISAVMLRECGAGLVELGHSERRQLYNETDETVNRKVLAALHHGLRPLVCVGETILEKNMGQTCECLARQVTAALRGVDPLLAGQVLLAYEPVWAIGSGGTPAEPAYIAIMTAFIRKVIAEFLGAQAANEVAVLYGGSVGPENALAYVYQGQTDGLFIGRAAWQVEGFIHILKLFS
jgi:L-erythrulose 1-phosphate isomerase